jgi:IPT/TIG domain/S-layer homology domain
VLLGHKWIPGTEEDMRHKSRKAAATLLLGALFLLTLGGAALAAPPWSDAPNAFWVQTYSVTDVQVGTVAEGYADGTFRPDQPVTRAEFAKMAVSGLGIATQNPATPTFMDVLPGSTFYAYVEGAYAAGLVEGMTTPAGKVFAPDADISRQQTNSILGRYLSGQEIEATGAITGILGGEAPGSRYPSLEAWYESEGFGHLARFADYQDVLPVHAPGTAYLIFREVIKGSGGMLHPRAKLSRAQAATMVLRVKGATFAPTPPTVSDVVPSSGPVAGGTTVIIWGSHLTGATAVTFGGANATSFHVDQDGGITAVVPAHTAGTVDVIVTSPYGSGVGADAYTYTTALPTIIFLSPNTGTTAGGTEVIIRGTDLTGTTAVMFGTTAAASFTVYPGDQILAIAPAHAAGTVDVIVTTPNGASVPTAGSVYLYSDLPPDALVKE